MRCRREVPAWPVEVAAGGPGTHAAGPGQRGPTGDRVEFPRTRSSGGRDDRVTTRALARRWAELAIWLFPLCQGPRHSGISIAVFGTAPSARAPGRVSWLGRTHGWHITCDVRAARRPAGNPSHRGRGKEECTMLQRQSSDTRTASPSQDRPLPAPAVAWPLPKPTPIPVVHWYV